MSIGSQLLAGVVAVLHIAIFAMESLLWRRPDVHRRFMVRTPSEAELVRPFIFNQGFYNLFLAVGIIVGLVLLHAGGSGTAGRTLVIFCCASVLAAALVLAGTDRRMLRAALIQGAPALLALALLPF